MVVPRLRKCGERRFGNEEKSITIVLVPLDVRCQMSDVKDEGFIDKAGVETAE